ncbi:hypothetical protein INT45_001609 [Circinella minor]|uniref:Ndc10 domain-containing protein n=1 Tax=Circinella minor TaxID=1195481 RepID=A0A8H7RUA8_9FUNG|nr:hypothetical protein INT45_001609 [Circinella minor]
MNCNFSSNASSLASSSSNQDADSNDNLNSSHAAALAENQAKEAEISGEMLAMKKMLQKNYHYEVEPNVFKVDELVTEAKLLRFLKEVVNKTGNRKCKRDDGETMALGYESNQQYIKAVIDLYHDQVAAGVNSHPHPRGQKVNTWRKGKAKHNRDTLYESFTDRGVGTLQDGYDYNEMVAVSLYFFTNRDHEPVAEMRNRASFLMHHMMMLCGENSRFAEFADLFGINFPEDEENSTPCPVLAFYSDFGKTLANRNRMYFAIIQHKDVQVCAFGAIAFYLFYRFHMSNEKFPKFTKNEDRYGLKLLKGKDAKKQMAYTTMNAPIVHAFRQYNITSLHTTHTGRGSGARDAELRGATEDQLCRHGCCNMQSMERHYLMKLSRASICAVNGFPTGKGRYWLRHALVQPEESLQRKIFPEVDNWLSKVESENDAERSISAQGFLRLMKTMRVVILQDAAVLREQHPTHPMFNHPIFQGQDFLSFAAASAHAVRTTPTPSHIQIQDVIPEVNHRLDDIDTKMGMYHRAELKTLRQKNAELKRSLGALHEKIDCLTTGYFRFVPSGTSVESVVTPPVAEVSSSSSSQPVQSSTSLASHLPSVSELEEKWNAAWRPSTTMRQWFSRRLLIVKAVKAIAEQKEIPHGGMCNTLMVTNI